MTDCAPTCGTCVHWRRWRLDKSAQGECTDWDARRWLLDSRGDAVTQIDWTAERMGCLRWGRDERYASTATSAP